MHVQCSLVVETEVFVIRELMVNSVLQFSDVTAVGVFSLSMGV